MILSDADKSPESISRQLKKYNLKDLDLQKRVETVLQTVSERDPQFNLTGYRNMWILKPNCNTLLM